MEDFPKGVDFSGKVLYNIRDFFDLWRNAP